MVGLMDLGEVAWEVEQVMNRWLEQKRPASAGAARPGRATRARRSPAGSPSCAPAGSRAKSTAAAIAARVPRRCGETRSTQLAAKPTQAPADEVTVGQVTLPRSLFDIYIKEAGAARRARWRRRRANGARRRATMPRTSSCAPRTRSPAARAPRASPAIAELAGGARALDHVRVARPATAARPGRGDAARSPSCARCSRRWRQTQPPRAAGGDRRPQQLRAPDWTRLEAPAKPRPVETPVEAETRARGETASAAARSA